MKRHHGLYVLTAMAMAILLTGCWGSTKSTALQLTGGSSVADTATAVGIDKCVVCHATTLDAGNPADNATPIFDMWKASFHATASSSHVDYATMAASGCSLRCHDPNGDGHRMASLGLPEKPTVGCEACHGGGSEHFGVGPMAYPKPDATACGQCHDQNMPHLAYHPNGLGGKGNPGIYAAYAGSAHAQSASLVLHGGTTAAARCAKCHTDEGARKFSLVDNVMTGSPIDCAVLYPALTQFSSVQCSTCHKAHGAGVKMLKDATAGGSAQYNTCVACHQDAPQIHNGGTYPAHDALLTHRHSVGAVTVGLIVNPTSTTACTECHNPHSADVTENLQWANSGHGDNNSEAFSAAENFSAQGACGVRCHSTTGYVVYTDNQSKSAVTADFVAAGTTGGRQETIYCRACHKVASTGFTVDRRTPQPAQFPAYYDNGTVTTSSYKQIAVWPATVGGKSVDKSSSGLCMNCHSSRRGGAQVRANLAGKNFSNYKFGLTSHHGPAAATLFQDNNFNATDNSFTGTGMYQFPGKNYAKVPYFEHDRIGTTAVGEGPVPTDNTNGPCVGCHMGSPAVAGSGATGSHTFLPFAYDNLGNVTAITSTTCAGCHAGQYAFTAADINTQKALFAARLAEFDNALNTAGIYFSATVSPNFFNNAAMNPATDNMVNWAAVTAAVTPTDNIALTNVDLLGVAYNRYYLSQETGAWAHNDKYAYRIIYDSIQKLGRTPSFARP